MRTVTTTMNSQNIPAIIISRDRAECLRSLVSWLETAGCEEIHIIDMCSTNPRLVEYLSHSLHTVHRLETNLGPHSIWKSGIVSAIAGDRYYIVSDPDVLPIEDCPTDAISFFMDVLRRYPSYVKVGFGLSIDDLPDFSGFADQLRAYESRYWQRRIRRNLYHARIDTTFALYRPGGDFQLGPAIRTGYPYLARHLPWYEDPNNLSADERYYSEHAGMTTGSTLLASGVSPMVDSTKVEPTRLSIPRRIKWRLKVMTSVREAATDETGRKFDTV